MCPTAIASWSYHNRLLCSRASVCVNCWVTIHNSPRILRVNTSPHPAFCTCPPHLVLHAPHPQNPSSSTNRTGGKSSWAIFYKDWLSFFSATVIKLAISTNSPPCGLLLIAIKSTCILNIIHLNNIIYTTCCTVQRIYYIHNSILI